MDEKHFRELFPEIGEKDDKEEEKRRKEFFTHMKMQLQPKTPWKLPEAAEITLREKKRKRRKMTVYSATAAACLILAIILPNLPGLLKLSEQKSDIRDGQESRDIDDSTELVCQNTGEMEEDVEDDNKPIENNEEIREIPEEPDIDKENGIEQKENSDGTGTKGVSEGKNGAEPGNEQGGQSSGEKTDVHTDLNNHSSKEPVSDDKEKEDPDDNDPSENDTGQNAYHDDNVKDADKEETDEAETENETVDHTVPADEAVSAEVTADETAEDTSITAESAEEVQDCTVSTTPSGVAPSDHASSVLEYALQEWWQEECMPVSDYSKADMASDTGSTQAAVSVENKITKEEVEKELEAYPYLYYLTEENSYGYYHATGKIQSSAEGMEYLAMAVICKEKTEDSGLGNNDQLNVYIYGYPHEFSKILVRFRAGGMDWYYVYEQ